MYACSEKSGALIERKCILSHKLSDKDISSDWSPFANHLGQRWVKRLDFFTIVIIHCISQNGLETGEEDIVKIVERLNEKGNK